MLPAVIAFFWAAMGAVSPVMPYLLTYIVIAGILLAAYYALYDSPCRLLAWVSLLVLSFDRNFLFLTVSQYADTLLAFLILLSYILYSRLYSSSKNRAYMIGFMAASAMWVKNEGILFFVIFSAGVLISNFKNFRLLLNYAAGTVIPLIIVVSFKWFFAPANDIIAGDAGNAAGLFNKATDYYRYVTIIKYAGGVMIKQYSYAVILLLAALLLNIKFFKSAAFIMLMLNTTGYLMVYVLTPHDLLWHLTKSLNRVLHHLYPALIYAVLYALSNRYADKTYILGTGFTKLIQKLPFLRREVQ